MTPRKPFKIFSSVIKALFLREMEMRLTVGRTGLFWTFAEPFFQIFMFVAIHAAIQAYSGSSSTHSYNYTVFMASGFIVFNLFRSGLSASSGAFNANKGLFNYKQVKPFDTVLARMLVTLFLSVLISMIFLFIGFVLEYDNLLPKNTLMVIVGIVWLFLFSLGINLLVAIGNKFYLSIGKLVGVSSFLLLFASAVFFPLNSVSPVVQKILLYNPLVHFMEMIHGAYVYGLDDRFVDYRYMFFWTILPLFVSFWLYIRLEKRIISL